MTLNPKIGGLVCFCDFWLRGTRRVLRRNGWR